MAVGGGVVVAGVVINGGDGGNVNGGGGTTGGGKDRILGKKNLLNWSPTAAAGAAVALDGGIMRPNDPNILARCHSRTGPHTVS